MSLIKRIFAVALLITLLLLVNLRQLWGALANLSLLSICSLLCVSFALIYVSAIKWKLFLDHFGSSEGALELFKLYLLGYFVNLLLPSYVGGDVARSYYVGRNIGQAEALTATILERYTGFLAMLLLGVVFVWFVDGVSWQVKIVVPVMLVALLTLTYCALSEGIVRRLYMLKSFKTVINKLEKIQRGFKLAYGNQPLFTRALFLSLLYHSLTVLNTLIAAYAVGWASPDPFQIFVVLPLILVIGALPITPSGIGLQEGAFFYFLQLVGATPEQALGVGIVLRAKTYLLALCGWFVWLRLGKECRET